MTSVNKGQFRCPVYAPAGDYGASSTTGSICQLTGTHMPHGITQCYLPPGRGDIPALTPAEAGTQLSDPGGMQGWVDLVGLLHTEMVYPPEDGHPSRYTNRARRALTSFIRRTPLTTTPRRQPSQY